MSDRDPREQQAPSAVGDTQSQSRSNISTDNQRERDAQDPSGTLDRRDPANDDRDEDDRIDTPGGLDQEKVEDRDNVGVVTPEDYPEQQ